MAKYTGPSCRLCRRQGMKLFLKGTKCSTAKCPFNKRAYAPGQHGQARVKLSDYGIQLREKQKVKRIYGILEKQFRVYFQKASKAKGVTGETLLSLLERRLDNAVFRAGLAFSRAHAREIVRHRHITVNDRIVNIPSFWLKKGDVIKLRGKEKFLKSAKDTLEVTKDRGVAEWISLDSTNMQAAVTRLPERSDVGFPIQEQLIIELYSK